MGALPYMNDVLTLLFMTWALDKVVISKLRSFPNKRLFHGPATQTLQETNSKREADR